MITYDRVTVNNTSAVLARLVARSVIGKQADTASIKRVVAVRNPLAISARSTVTSADTTCVDLCAAVGNAVAIGARRVVATADTASINLYEQSEFRLIGKSIVKEKTHTHEK